MRKIYIAAKIFTTLCLHKIVPYLRPKLLSGIPVLTYHRVTDLDGNYPFDSSLISASKSNFSRQIEYISYYFNPITMEQLVDFLYKNKPLPKNPVLVTFDDGFDDNYHNAFPILKKYNVPATIFVTTGFVDSEEPIWFERLAYFFYRLKTIDSFVIDEILKEVLNIKNVNSNDAYNVAVLCLKKMDNELRINTIRQLYDRYEDLLYDGKEQDRKLSQPLSWEQIREMGSSIINIGSHSVNHPILSKLDSESLNIELKESKARLEDELTINIETFAYPDGQINSYDSSTVKLIEEAGYKVAFSYQDGMSYFLNLNKYTIKRLHVDYDHTFSYFKSKLALPELFSER